MRYCAKEETRHPSAQDFLTKSLSEIPIIVALNFYAQPADGQNSVSLAARIATVYTSTGVIVSSVQSAEMDETIRSTRC